MVNFVAKSYVKTIVCGVAIIPLDITLILQPSHDDVKFGPLQAHGNRPINRNYVKGKILSRMYFLCR